MTKTKSKFLVAIMLILILVSSYCFATEETAQITSAEDVALTAENADAGTTGEEAPEWTKTDLYICEDTVNVSNVVDGNAFIIGKDVTISGEIGGDLFVIADKLNIDGAYIYSNLFVCANEITVNGVVYDVYAMGGNFTLGENGFIYRDAKIASNNVTISGTVRRDAYIMANNISFGENSGAIYGNFNYSAPSEIEIPENGVLGEVKYKELKADKTQNIGSIILYKVLDLIEALVYTFIIALLLVWLTPKFVERVGKMGVGKSFASLGIGVATPIVLIIASIILLTLYVTSSIVISGIFGFVILAFIGNTVASIFFGKLFVTKLKMEGKVKFFLFTLVSRLIIWVISLIPFVGGFFGFLVSMFGIGATLINMLPAKEKIKEVTE